MKKLMTMIGAALAAAIPALADLPALSVSVSGNDVSVTAAAGVLDDTSALYLVWDTEDRGTSLVDWPAENRIAYSGSPAISSAAATYTLSKASVPAGAYVRVLATSNVRLIGGYVQLASGQYVDTGIADSAAWGVDVKIQPIASSSNYLKLMGSISDRFTIGRIQANDTNYYVRWGGSGLTGSTNQGTQLCGYNKSPIDIGDDTTAHTIRIANREIYVDGSQHTPDTAVPENTPCGQTGKTILLGGVWDYSGDNTTATSTCNDYWHYAQILDSDSDALVNLVPALRGDAASPEAVFYDTVSGACFANAGTGTLAYSGSMTNTVAIAAAATESLYNGRVATWTGGGNASDATDPDNWSVTDMGIPVAGAIPANGTIIAGCTLAADADWSALEGTATWIQPVEYVDVVKGVYVDTEFCPNSNTRVVMDVTISAITGDDPYPFRLFGVYTNTWNNGAFCLGNDKKGLFSAFDTAAGTDNDTSTWIPVGRHTVDYDKGVVKVDGTTTKTRTATFTLDKALYLFLTNDKGTVSDSNAGPFRFHSCQIYDNGTLVRDYVPVIVGGVAKIYDRKNAELVEFKKKAGTETVTPGAASGGRIGGDVIEIDGTIDLAGYNLTVGDLSGTGTITDTVGGGELHVSVASGFGVENTGVTLAGSLKLVKEGAGTLVGAKAGQTYTGGTLVSGGWAQSGVGDAPWGASKSLITVADGASFDWAGVASTTSMAYSFNIAGTGPDGNGALCNSVANAGWNLTCLADLTLSDDALIGCYGFFGFTYNGDNSTWHTLTMNGHTLNIKMTGSGTSNNDAFAMRTVKTVGTGTIAFVDSDGSGCYPSFFGGVSDLSTATLDIGEGYRINIDKADMSPTVGTFIDRRSGDSLDVIASKRSFAITVLDSFKPMTTNLVRTVMLGDATHLSPVLDLSELDGPFVLPEENYSIGMASGATINVTTGERTIARRTPVISWTTKPEYIDSLSFKMDVDGSLRRMLVQDDGIYLPATGLIIMFR